MTGARRFLDRADAGRAVAALVRRLSLRDPVVLALPRGGVPVGFEVARALAAPLDVFVVRKVGLPHQPELGVGALAEGGRLLLDDATLVRRAVPRAELEAVVERERQELTRRIAAYRGDRPLPRLSSRDVVVADDGLATGVTARAALQALRAAGVGRLVLAVPVGPPDTLLALAGEADELVCVLQPDDVGAVSRWYEDFRATSDQDVRDLLAASMPTQEP